MGKIANNTLRFREHFVLDATALVQCTTVHYSAVQCSAVQCSICVRCTPVRRCALHHSTLHYTEMIERSYESPPPSSSSSCILTDRLCQMEDGKRAIEKAPSFSFSLSLPDALVEDPRRSSSEGGVCSVLVWAERDRSSSISWGPRGDLVVWGWGGVGWKGGRGWEVSYNRERCRGRG